MRSVHASYSASIAHDELKMAELYTIALADGVTTLRYTSHGSDIVWDAAGNTYTAYPIARGPIGYKNSGEFDDLEIYLANIEGDLYDKVAENILETVTVTVKRIMWSETYAATKEITLFIGRADVTFNRGVLQLTCRPIINSLNISVPRHLYQEPCNNALFGASCGLTRATYAYAGTATGGTNTTLIDTTRGTLYSVPFDAVTGIIAIGETVTGGAGGGTGVVVQIVYLTATTGTIWYVEQTGIQFVDDEILSHGADNVTVNGTPVEDTTFYARGELEITGGDNIGHRRPIYNVVGGTFTVFWPFPYAISAGDTYKVYPGCDKTGETCFTRFNNKIHFRGFPFIPRIEETIF